MGDWRRLESGIVVPDEIAGSWDRVAQNRYVAHADMLGMSGLTLRDPKLAWNAVSKMTRAKKRVFDLAFTVGGRYIRIRDRVGSFTFSDTIVLFTKGDEEQDLRAILICCLELFGQVLAGSIPIRLGVAHGLFVFNGDEGLFVGPPLVRAHDIGESAQWVGAVLDDTVAGRARELRPEFLDTERLPLVVDWDVPVKSGSPVRLPALAWPRSHRRNFTTKPPISAGDFYRAFEQLFGRLSRIRARERRKYENTVKFVNAMLPRNKSG